MVATYVMHLSQQVGGCETCHNQLESLQRLTRLTSGKHVFHQSKNVAGRERLCLWSAHRPKEYSWESKEIPALDQPCPMFHLESVTTPAAWLPFDDSWLLWFRYLSLWQPSISFCFCPFSRQKCTSSHHKKMALLFVTKIFFVLGKHYDSPLPFAALMLWDLMSFHWFACSEIGSNWAFSCPLWGVHACICTLVGCALFFSNSLQRGDVWKHFFISRHLLTSLGWVMSNVSRTERVPLVTARFAWAQGQMSCTLLRIPGEYYLFPG